MYTYFVSMQVCVKKQICDISGVAIAMQVV